MRCGHVSCFHRDSAVGQRINVGSLDVGHDAFAAEIGKAVVVGVDDDDVGLCVSGTKRWTSIEAVEMGG